MKPTDPVTSLKGSWLRESDKAVLFSITEVSGTPLEKPVSTWFPFSQMLRSSKNPNKLNDDTLVVSQWIFNQKNIELPAKNNITDVDEEGGTDYSYDDLPDVDIPY